MSQTSWDRGPACKPLKKQQGGTLTLTLKTNTFVSRKRNAFVVVFVFFFCLQDRLYVARLFEANRTVSYVSREECARHY